MMVRVQEANRGRTRKGLTTPAPIPWRQGKPSLLTVLTSRSARLGLSPQECEITRLVARDLTNKEIAAVLEISCWTVAAHLRRIFAKLGVHSRAAMVAHVLDEIAAAEDVAQVEDVDVSA